MDELQLKLCDIQGRLFELSAVKKLPSAAFIKAFMTSETAKALDSRYNRMQWMGEEYQLEEVLSSAGIHFPLQVRSIQKMCCTGLAISIVTGTITPAKAVRKSCGKPLPQR